jgi:hypothetical protein
VQDFGELHFVDSRCFLSLVKDQNGPSSVRPLKKVGIEQGEGKRSLNSPRWFWVGRSREAYRLQVRVVRGFLIACSQPSTEFMYGIPKAASDAISEGDFPSAEAVGGKV